MKSNILIVLALSVFAALVVSVNANERAGLILTKPGIEKIQRNLGSVPLFDQSLAELKQEVDAEIERGIDTPIPKDFSGGYTHQRHKANFFMLQKAGVLFQILEDEKYAVYVRDMLLQYEAMYKTLPLHPQTRSYARGKLFWQNLNDANWLVYAAQGYDAIYDWLPVEQRELLEDNLFRPFADHISIDSPQFFNRVHNHSTWGAAAVGMIGLAMQDDALVERALYGIPIEALDMDAKDNDGGFIFSRDGKAGFLANLNAPFSPDGYYTEGPYYQRYAMYPFLIFAQALQNTKPELQIFEHKDGVLLKAVSVLLNLTNAQGEFFPLNDGQKGMSIQNDAVVSALNLAYYYGKQDPALLSIAQTQGRVTLDDAGFAVAVGVRDGQTEDFIKPSLNYSDGENGDEGGLSLLRSQNEELSLLFKYTAQGLSHGHFDKLSFSLFDEHEVLQDYGMVRFVNVGQKGGGNYLPENNSWAKQSVAHNTLVQNQESHFEGKYEIGSQHHSDLWFFDNTNRSVHIVSALDENAYPGTTLRRTMALITDEEFEKPLVIDLFKVNSQTKNDYDLPFYYFGQVLQTSFDIDAAKPIKTLGTANGYQHLYVEATGTPDGSSSQFSWMSNNKFYTITTLTDPTDRITLARVGANDPDFNLRRDPALIVQRPNVNDSLFASVIEPHGGYDPVSESARNSYSQISSIDELVNSDDYSGVLIKTVKGGTKVLVVANRDNTQSAQHALEIDGTRYEWSGPYYYATIE